TPLERSCKFFDHRRLAGASDRKVSDADNQASELALFQNSFAVEVKSKMNDRKPRTIRRSVARKPRLLSRMTSIAYCSRSSNLLAILTLLNDQGTIIIGAYDQDF